MTSLRIDRRDPDGRVALLTLDRPERRNALDRGLRRDLWEALRALDADDATAAIVLTGADPAFCAGVDLTELADTAADDGPGLSPPVPELRTPLIGAVNGPAVTGGLEVALRCDFLVASERARFADTHVRVGVQPTWGLTTLLPAAVGIRLAVQMSLTGEYLDAARALAAGLVNLVVPHPDLLPTALGLAASIAQSDAGTVAYLKQTYREAAELPPAEAMVLERARGAAWLRGLSDRRRLVENRHAVIEHGRRQQATRHDTPLAAPPPLTEHTQ
ncbi:MAG: enoyl-CoA hydratase [Acidimicrobiia bacterium]|nr:MAG: enoyl-CoA hydratase [Acidimicrobiia bacterium]